MNKEIIQSIRRFYETNIRLRKVDSLLIITSKEIDKNVPHYLKIVGGEYTHKVEVHVINRLNKGVFQPSKSLTNLSKKSTVIIAPTEFSLFHTPFIQKACERGVKFVAMTGADLRTFYIGAAKADFVKLKGKVKRMAKKLTIAKKILIKTSKGTLFYADISNRKGNAETGIAQYGKKATFPDIEANISIREETGYGKVIVDGSVGGFGLLKSSISIFVEKGKIVKIDGGKVAKTIFQKLEEFCDPNIFQIAEIGIGLNPESSIRGIIIEDEATLGTAHIGIGNNIFMGGCNNAKGHIDFVFKRPIIYLDDIKVIDHRTHLF